MVRIPQMHAWMPSIPEPEHGLTLTISDSAEGKFPGCVRAFDRRQPPHFGELSLKFKPVSMESEKPSWKPHGVSLTPCITLAIVGCVSRAPC
jgi:hypothetical protein